MASEQQARDPLALNKGRLRRGEEPASRGSEDLGLGPEKPV